MRLRCCRSCKPCNMSKTWLWTHSHASAADNGHQGRAAKLMSVEHVAEVCVAKWRGALACPGMTCATAGPYE